MGMDLVPISPTSDAPRYPLDSRYELLRGKLISPSYSISEWNLLLNRLDSWGVDVAGFSSFNDGDRISAEICRAVADAIEANLHTLPYDGWDDDRVGFTGSHNWDPTSLQFNYYTDIQFESGRVSAACRERIYWVNQIILWKTCGGYTQW